ncbi:MAG: putative IclR family transcriptional regulator [Ilumatobacteraceae bacterium]|nr:putative IclR family transcriptional regulator [Ilumatobacteraceae bacterium]
MDSVGRVGVLDKGISIIAAVAEGPLDLAGLQRVTGLPRATAHRLAVALERHHLLRRDASGRFCLGFELIRLGRLATDAFPLAELARPALVALRDRTGESVQLYVREGDARRCIVSLQSPHALRWTVAEGALLPLGIGSAGKVLDGTGIGGARRGGASNGVVESVEEREPGVASVSAPVTDRDGVILGAVSVSGPVERLSRAPRRRFGRDVERAAAEIGVDVASRLAQR